MITIATVFIAITIIGLLVTLYYGLREYTGPEIFSAMVTLMAFIYLCTMIEI